MFYYILKTATYITKRIQYMFIRTTHDYRVGMGSDH